MYNVFFKGEGTFSTAPSSPEQSHRALQYSASPNVPRHVHAPPHRSTGTNVIQATAGNVVSAAPNNVQVGFNAPQTGSTEKSVITTPPAVGSGKPKSIEEVDSSLKNYIPVGACEPMDLGPEVDDGSFCLSLSSLTRLSYPSVGGGLPLVSSQHSLHSGEEDKKERSMSFDLKDVVSVQVLFACLNNISVATRKRIVIKRFQYE